MLFILREEYIHSGKYWCKVRLTATERIDMATIFFIRYILKMFTLAIMNILLKESELTHIVLECTIRIYIYIYIQCIVYSPKLIQLSGLEKHHEFIHDVFSSNLTHTTCNTQDTVEYVGKKLNLE
jgi:hypothetical protein